MRVHVVHAIAVMELNSHPIYYFCITVEKWKHLCGNNYTFCTAENVNCLAL